MDGCSSHEQGCFASYTHWHQRVKHGTVPDQQGQQWPPTQDIGAMHCSNINQAKDSVLVVML